MSDTSPALDAELERIADEQIVRPGVAKSAVLALAQYRQSWLVSIGAAGQVRTRDALFDLASVTKPFLALSVARLCRTGLLGWADTLDRHLPEAAGTPSGKMTLELLLSHRAGLVPHRALFAPLMRRHPFRRNHALWIALHARRPDCLGQAAPEHGFPPVYSDLGYLLVGAALEKRFSCSLETLVASEVLEPLGLNAGSMRQLLGRTGSTPLEIIRTEHVAWRGGTLRGRVHDENAWALSGHGLSGHAGLFGTADAVVRLGCRLIDILEGRHQDYLSRDQLEYLIRPREGGTLRLGFDGKSSSQSSAGQKASPLTFGHLGFTGTSLWCDPAAQTVVVLLTNRVYPTRENTAIRAARPRVHDALFSLVRKSPTIPGPIRAK